MDESNLRPITIFASYLCVAGLLTVFILRNLFRQWSITRQSNIPKHELNSRLAGVQLFSALAALSLATTWYYMFSFFGLSYLEWAAHRGIQLPDDSFAQSGLLYIRELEVGRWLKNSTLFKEAWETAISSPQRFWWTQQIFLFTTAWSYFLGIRGSKRSHRCWDES
jgi:hypothetical protein